MKGRDRQPVGTTKTLKAILYLILADFIVCFFAFLLEIYFNYESYPNTYFAIIDISRVSRILYFAFTFYIILGYNERLDYPIELTNIIRRLVLFACLFYAIDLLKIILAYSDIVIWKELFVIKKIPQLTIYLYYIFKFRKPDKNISFIYN